MQYRYCIIILFNLFVLLTLGAPRVVKGEDDTHVYLPVFFHQYQGSHWRWDRPEALVFPESVRATSSNIDGQGNLLLLADAYSPPHFIYFAVLGSAGWSDLCPVAEPLGRSELLGPPRADAQGNLHLIWSSDLGTGTNRHRLHYARWDGVAWEFELDIHQSNQSPRWAAITFDVTGAQQIALTEENGFGRIERLRKTGNGWELLPPLDVDRLVLGVWPDQSERLHILGLRGLFQTGFAYWRWEAERFTILNEEIGGETPLTANDVFDGGGNFHRVWREVVPVPGGTVMGAYHTCMNTERAWQEQVVLSGNRSVSDLTVLEPTGNSPFAALWREGGIAHPQLGVWDGCELREQGPVTTITTGDLVSLTYRGERLCVLARLEYQNGYLGTCAAIESSSINE